ncbi:MULTISPECIES: hypothetical protein [unclassified Anabaena]|uniref:hypothetical protein n=1 Tax=unclassified Anabaena TaxID=2619674 RepID=UPI001447EABC|nr:MULTISPECIES: hypothetical protein [unclassified Anabaena]MTJ06117.1 hypothetical protein [Anabaena sp. UHCC 0204]MTJ54792.1 hypothetical protein [Anabaena sp. UHCC 0253]
MNKKFILTLISSPVLFTSMLSMVMMARPAHANQVIKPATTTSLSCVRSSDSARLSSRCIKESNAATTVTESSMQGTQAQPNNPDELEFTDADSDLAIKLFGCDCPVCVTAARQLNGIAPLPV